MILFEKIRWKNLLSTGNHFTEIQLDRSNNTLIVGTNGAGKSTLLDALCFGLFGKPFRSINKPGLINSINERDCVVEIEFKIGERAYKVIRGIKPNIFEIYCNGVLVNQDAASKDYQEVLEKSILKLNMKSFTQVVILGSASFTPFMQLSPADRRLIIEDLLDIQIFSSMNTLVKDKLSEIKDGNTKLKYELELMKLPQSTGTGVIASQPLPEIPTFARGGMVSGLNSSFNGELEEVAAFDSPPGMLAFGAGEASGLSLFLITAAASALDAAAPIAPTKLRLESPVPVPASILSLFLLSSASIFLRSAGGIFLIRSPTFPAAPAGTPSFAKEAATF